MKIRSILLLCSVVLWYALTSTIKDPNNPPTGRTGAPGETTCGASGCHSGGAYTGSVTISGIPDTVLPNQSYTVTLTNTSNAVRAGFELTCLDATNAKCGTFTAGSGSSIGTGSGSKQYVRQSTPKNLSGGSAAWTFTWKAPATLANPAIHFYFVSLAANGNGNKSGDNVLQANKTVTLYQPVSGSEDIANNAIVSIFPNPVSGQMHITLAEGKKGVLTISDLQGKVVLESKLTESETLIQTGNLPKGVYTASVRVDGAISSKQIIVQ